SDAVNKFTEQGRTPLENSIFNYTKALANFRKTSSALKTGKLMQFVPEDGVYTYFRYDKNQTVMVIMNTAKEDRTVDTKRFSERLNGFKNSRSIVDGSMKELGGAWKIAGKSVWVLECTSP
ncbi:MAG TPA: cyclomaltodextrinase C-terminal domain-containing protein, partial [Flavisolibacter sp.]|nr:cyclomaltodextrinase C-terminal domain-containing protein [Flavisolibacter sp.]